ncbi:MAG: hypothetical protein LW710_14810 [Burkholderiales bacterium]|jgi:hypothetical protein|uniref:hypothetical protein n=1 Tax=Limnobacter sp. TaxID=2003368 RepID=UPI00395EF1A6|nr:hypothetical protein [Burkholderiales bacterium]
MREAKRLELHKLPGQGKSETLSINPETIHLACIRAVDATELVHWYLVELSSLFESIKALDNNEFSTINRLAELGKYLCADWAGTADCAREEVVRHLQVLNSMMSAKGEKHV